MVLLTAALQQQQIIDPDVFSRDVVIFMWFLMNAKIRSECLFIGDNSIEPAGHHHTHSTFIHKISIGRVVDVSDRGSSSEHY